MFRLVMSVKQFKFLICYIRFDEKVTHEKEEKYDKFHIYKFYRKS